MSSTKKLEKDYMEYSEAIEKRAKDEIKKIKEQVQKVKQEAEKTGESIKQSTLEKCSFEE